MDQTYRYAQLASSLRWAFEALSEVATALLEMERSDLSAQAFESEIQVAKLHGKLVELLKDAPTLPVRKDPSHTLDHQIPF